VHGDLDAFAELLELEHGGRPLHVGGHQQHLAALALQVTRELRRDGRLADALQPTSMTE
jgi:hypothetical protein